MPLNPKQQKRLTVIKTVYGEQAYVLSLSPEQVLDLVLNGETEIAMEGVGSITIAVKPAAEPV